jgi:DNA-binding response OmpR family regulator
MSKTMRKSVARGGGKGALLAAAAATMSMNVDRMMPSADGNPAQDDAQRQKINLQRRAFQLLEYLLRHSGEFVTRVETSISRLRAKADRNLEVALINTIHDTGYVVRATT